MDKSTECKSNKGYICIYGAREHNLKSIDLSIPSKKLTVITGLSGSGKSSLAFDTIYAEGQRRYMETFSAYARQFIGNMERPDVDKITGLSPVISIEQKTTNKNPRSTVGTSTEIYDFLRLMYARAGEAYSYNTGERMVKYSNEQIINLIHSNFEGQRIYILAPIVKGRKGHYKELFQAYRRKGYLNVRVDGVITELKPDMITDRYKVHDIEILIDKLAVDGAGYKRLKESLEMAMLEGDGVCMIINKDTNEAKYYSKHLMCPTTGISYQEPAPHSFSFNSPHGACRKCKGLGYVNIADNDKIVPDPSLSIYKGGISPLGKYTNTIIFQQIEAILKKYDCNLKTPISDIPEDAMDDILNGTPEPLKVTNPALGTTTDYLLGFDGIIKYINMQSVNNSSKKAKSWADQYISTHICPVCNGQRLKKESLYFKIKNKNIAEVAKMDLLELSEWLDDIEDFMSDRQKAIAVGILKEIRTRLKFLTNVGLGYLSLNRNSVSLSGGEAQRIQLATQLGSQLVNVLYILDEPSIGLHQRDNRRLIDSLRRLRDSGNTVIVVEHDKEMIESADYIVDVGPRAGVHGGEITAAGTLDEILQSDSITARYLKGISKIEIPETRRKGNGKFISLRGCKGHNLKNIDVDFPLGKLICITGVSGSGKSSLVNGTLHPILSQKFYRSVKSPLEYDSIEGMDNIDKVVEVNQAPIGRTPRSNPVTYTGIFDEIRKLFAQLPEALIRGYKSSRFSFNVAGGRCDECKGGGMKVIEMNFLPNVNVKCTKCHGKRYNKETLDVRYRGKSISDVLDMTINQAIDFFDSFPKILHKLQILQEVGLGYLTLGQSSTTLSGGEAQRIKLASELAKRDTGKTLYILDEPTTGLHFEDIRVLMKVINKLIGKGNTVIIIEHNLDVIKTADYIIDIGPEGGRDGGRVLCTGTPEEVAQDPNSETAKYLKKELQ